MLKETSSEFKVDKEFRKIRNASDNEILARLLGKPFENKLFDAIFQELALQFSYKIHLVRAEALHGVDFFLNDHSVKLSSSRRYLVVQTSGANGDALTMQ